MAAVVAQSETADKIRKKRSREIVYEKASAKQLALQPPEAKRPPDYAPPHWLDIKAHLEARINMMTAWRFSWAQHWSLLESYILPRRGIFINTAQPTPNTMIRGLPINQNIVDPTGTQAMRVCAAGLMSGLMSPSRPWFKLKPATIEREEAEADAQAWFEEVEDRMYTIMGRSNFYDAGAQMMEDLTTFGSGPMIIYEDEIDIIRCYTPCPGEYYLAVGSNGRVESMYRKFNLTIAQIVEMFGINNCPRDVQGMWMQKGAALEMERLVAHSIEPNFAVNRPNVAEDTGVVPGDFSYREIYWIWGASAEYPLSVRGFIEPPHICPRWAVTSNDPYGRSVGMDVLPDIMQLQQETRRKAEAIEKLVRPPLLGDMSLKNEPSSILPGHVTFVAGLNATNGMRPVYTVNPDVKAMMEDLKEIQQRIQRGFFMDLFLLQSMATKEMTAFEVAQRQQEKLQVLGPVIERFENEAATPAIKRIYSIMARKGLLPPLPPSLQNVPISIEYVSMLRLAQRAAATAGLEQFSQMATALSQIYPEAKFALDPIETLSEYREHLGVSVKAMRPKQDIQRMAAQEAQQQQQMQQLAAANSMAQTGKAASGIDVGGGLNAVSMMTGLGASPGGNA